ncbi:CDP-alcohol phosphatidyltransferase-domain-containing protein [Aspergillus cavernicola]|uniref:CDP-diacylglycerol--inositol 3-phosphatidyltransferase n=1 Tax=Aspergillus cavernicola TaxID=176166 RepID=A0ABR4IRU9_9EURO
MPQLTPPNIFFFIPNLIGYTRILLATLSLYYMPTQPLLCTLLYTASSLLDALDGLAARHFNQSTRFGAVLDMLIDRCATTCLLIFLASVFPTCGMVFQGLISLDFASHFAHMYATLVMGGTGRSHKSVDAAWPWVLRGYYSNLTVLFTICTLNELFFITVYLLSFSDDDSASLISGWWVSRDRGGIGMRRENTINSYWPTVFFYISLPFMLYKQYINVLQLVYASRWIAQGDVEARVHDESMQGKGE